MKKYFYNLFCLFICIISFSANGLCQSGDSVSVITTKQGLSINSVNDIIFDREGFLWAATSDGLQRYDGYSFKTFKKKLSDPGSLSENTCRHLFEDINGNIWVGHNSLISVKKKIDGRFTSIKINNFYTALKPFAEDSAYVWIVGVDHFFLVNKNTFTVEHDFIFANNIFPDSLTAFIARSPVKSCGIFNYFLQANAVAFKKYHITDDVTNGTEKNIYTLFNFFSGSANPTINQNGKIYTVAASARVSLYEYVLLINNKGFCIYNTKTALLQKHPLSDLIEKNIDYRLVTGMVLDAGKNIWFSQSGKGGIVCIKNVQHPFRTFIKSNKDVLIYGLQNDPENNIYVSAYRKFINAYNEKGQFFKTFSSPVLETIPGGNLPNTIRALKMINSKEFLLLSTNGQALLLNSKTALVKDITSIIPASPRVVNDIFDIQIFQLDSTTFIFNHFNQLVKLSVKNSILQVETVCKIAAEKSITSFYPLGNERWLLGTTNGLFTSTPESIMPVKGTSGVHVKYIAKDQPGRFWAATEAGIFIIKEGALIKTLTEQNELSSSFVYGILFDKKNRAWCSSNKGLMRIDSSFTVKAFTQSNGLLNDEFNTNGFLKHPNGNFYFAGLEGIDYFNPDEFEEDTSISAIHLADLKVNYANYGFTKNADGSISLSAPYDKNNLSFSFSVMDFYNPSVNQFSYYLKGYQSEWSLPTNNNEVNYILPPGEYTLLVKGANHNGVWSSTPLVIKISIIPAWYQTALFKWGLGFTGLFLIGTVLYSLNKRKYRRKLAVLNMQQQIQKEKERLSRDLHDNLGSQMALLSNNVENLEINFKKQQHLDDSIEKVKGVSKQLLQTLREAIWILNKEEVTAQDFFDKLIEYTQRYLQSYPSIQLQITEDFLFQQTLNSNEALQLFRICQEVIANACKYSESKILLLAGRTQQDNFEISIQDFGKGFDSNKINEEGHYGLKNIQQRANAVKADLFISTATGKGTMVTIKI